MSHLTVLMRLPMEEGKSPPVRFWNFIAMSCFAFTESKKETALKTPEKKSITSKATRKNTQLKLSSA
ncbi:hypothetical protein BDV06DRAFT_125137 [Aspergillus oleicola]